MHLRDTDFFGDLGLRHSTEESQQQDPLFALRRRDRRIGLDLSVRNKEWRWLNFTPALLLTLERTESNIDFYSYRKANFFVVLE